VRGSNIHETVIFHIIFRILEVSGGRWRVPWSLSDYVFFLICAVSVKLPFPTR